MVLLLVDPVQLVLAMVPLLVDPVQLVLVMVPLLVGQVQLVLVIGLLLGDQVQLVRITVLHLAVLALAQQVLVMEPQGEALLAVIMQRLLLALVLLQLVMELQPQEHLPMVEGYLDMVEVVVDFQAMVEVVVGFQAMVEVEVFQGMVGVVEGGRAVVKYPDRIAIKFPKLFQCRSPDSNVKQYKDKYQSKTVSRPPVRVASKYQSKTVKVCKYRFQSSSGGRSRGVCVKLRTHVTLVAGTMEVEVYLDLGCLTMEIMEGVEIVVDQTVVAQDLHMQLLHLDQGEAHDQHTRGDRFDILTYLNIYLFIK